MESASKTEWKRCKKESSTTTKSSHPTIHPIFRYAVAKNIWYWSRLKVKYISCRYIDALAHRLKDRL